MRHRWISTLSIAMAGPAMAAVPSVGNVLMLQVGDGTTALSSSAAPLTLREVTVSGGTASIIQSVPIASTGSNALTIAGTATSEGYLTQNTGYIGIAGYVADSGTAAVSTTTSATALRHAIGFNLQADLAAGPQLNATTTTHDGGNIRSALVLGGTGFYTVGGGSPGGPSPVYFPDGSVATAGTLISSNITSARTMRVVNGNLYVSHQETTRGIDTVSGTPTTTGNASSLAVATPAAGNGGVAVNMGDFFISNDLSTVYLADEGNTDKTQAGIKKYVFDSGTSKYVLQYTISTDYDGAGAATSGARYLAMDNSGANPLFYAVSMDGTRLLSLSDLGNKAASDASLAVLMTSSANTEFRGLTVVVPEPASLSVLAGVGLLLRRRRR